MDKSERRLLAQGIFAAIALTAGGFFAGAKKLVWGLWIFISGAWVLVWLMAMANNPDEKAVLYLLAAFVPPVVLLFIIRIISAIVDVLRGVTNDIAEAKSSIHPSEGPANGERLGQVSSDDI